jgi:regulatory protein
VTDPSPIPLITRIQPLKPRGLKVLVHLDRGEAFEVMLEALERDRLGAGDPLPPNRRHRLLNADADIRVRDAALNLLSYRARTHTELRRRLRKKGFAPARIGPCLDRLQEKGFLDDEAVAAAFVRDRLRHRPRGTMRLSQELRAKGVDEEVATRTIARVFEDEDVTDAALALDSAAGWLRRQSAEVLRALAGDDDRAAREKARRRLNGYLARRGFRGEALGAAMRHAQELSRGG